MIGNEEGNEPNDIPHTDEVCDEEPKPSDNGNMEVHESVVNEQKIVSDETTSDHTTNNTSSRQTTHTRSG